MAKETHDREDLLRDGMAMIHRGQTIIDGKEVFVGYRADGQASLYWDQDPVFQFNSSSELRRVYIDGVKLLAQQRQLLILKRHASAPSLRELSSDAVMQRLDQCLEKLAALPGSAEEAGWQTVGQDTDDFHRRVREWAKELRTEGITIADEPHAK